MSEVGVTNTRNRAAALTIILAAALSCTLSIALLLWGLLHEGPAFYNGQECRMTYSHFQFLPLRVVLPSSLQSQSQLPTQASPSPPPAPEGRYRLLKFADARDPRHKHFFPISGSMVENYESQSNPKRRKQNAGSNDNENGNDGRLLELEDNWCLLPRDTLQKDSNIDKWRGVPHPHRGHPVLYIPGHWGSFSQARSIGAHGTRWTGPYAKGKTDQEIYESLRNGKDMHDGSWTSTNDTDLSSAENVMNSLLSSHSKQSLDGFVMDVFSLDFDGQGGALHSSTLFRQAEFFARAVETIVEGCQLQNNDGRGRRGITVVAHSIGAWVVRIALKMHPHLTKDGWIRNVVTLASPLGSVPYAVDSGVHEIAKHINDVSDNEGDVAMISISGGLRDEMIPPEVCQVPPASTSHNNGGKSGIVNDAFLASSIMEIGSSTVDGGHYGMDHRAIVWCYDLLTVVREVIFSLVIATDKGLVSTERMAVAQRIMHGEQKTSVGNIASYQDDVENQHVKLLQEKGYLKMASIQLSAPYHLNSLLKLCIAATLLHTIAILPILQYLRQIAGRSRRTRGSFADKCFAMALSLLAVPAFVVMATWVRQLEFSLFEWGPWRACYGQECSLLLGTSFILSQLATLIHFLIVRGVCAIISTICNKCSSPIGKNIAPSRKSFRTIFLHSCMQQFRLLALAVLPLTTAVCFTINTFIRGHDDSVWNLMAVASYCYISSLLLIFTHLIILACKPYQVNYEQRRSELLILFLSLVKATFGKMLYAFSLTTQWGQSDLNFYDDFLALTSNVGVFGGHQMITSTITLLLPAFFAMIALKTHDIMSGNSTRYWNETRQLSGNGDTSMETDMKPDSPNTVTPQYNEPTIIAIANACFVCWYTWNVFLNFSQDDIVVTFFSFVVCVTTYLRCIPYSSEVVDICTAIMSNDLTLECDRPQNHDKSE